VRRVSAIGLLVPVVLASVASAQPAPAPRPGRTATTPWVTEPAPNAAPVPAPAPAPAPVAAAAPPAKVAVALPRPVYVRKAPPPSKIVYARPPAYDYTWRFAVTAGYIGADHGYGRDRFTARAGRRLGAYEVAVGLAWDGQVRAVDSTFGDRDNSTWDDAALTAMALRPFMTRSWRFAPGLGLSAHRTVVDETGRESDAGYSVSLDGEVSMTVVIWHVEVGARLRWRTHPTARR
jgi:hypothetical protein